MSGFKNSRRLIVSLATPLIALAVFGVSCSSEPSPDLETFKAGVDERCAAWTETLASYGEVPSAGGIVTADYLAEVLRAFNSLPDGAEWLPQPFDYKNLDHRAIADEWDDASSTVSFNLKNFENHFDPSGDLVYSPDSLFIDYLEILRSANSMSAIAQDVAGNDCEGLDGLRSTMTATSALFANDWGQYSLTGDVGNDVSTACHRHLDDLPVLSQFDSFGADRILDAKAIQFGFSDFAADLSRITTLDEQVASHLEVLITSAEKIASVAGSVSRGGSGAASADAAQDAQDALAALGADC